MRADKKKVFYSPAVFAYNLKGTRSAEPALKLTVRKVVLKMGKIYEGLKLDAERALYGERDAVIRRCVFDGPADGESALKECGGITAEDCDFHLRYPFWHVTDGLVQNCRMTETCRAALWYDRGMHVENSRLGGIKALRECDDTVLSGCEIESTEFGWFCRGLKITDCTLKSEYPFMQTRGMEIENLRMQGKYSFQYVENVTIRDSVLDTKDAFWHGKNITVEDSVVKGEYLAWYSENLRLVRCKIIGTQPFCYAKNLVLEDCEMIDCDLAFENTTVEEDVRGEILSVKNPAGGHITADSIGEILLDEHRWPGAACAITERIGKRA